MQNKEILQVQREEFNINEKFSEGKGRKSFRTKEEAKRLRKAYFASPFPPKISTSEESKRLKKEFEVKDQDSKKDRTISVLCIDNETIIEAY